MGTGRAARTVLVAMAMGVVAGACSSTPDSSVDGQRSDPGRPTTGANGSTGDQPSTTASTAPPTTRPLRSFTLAASGDILLHALVIQEGQRNAGGRGGYDFDPLFDEVRDRLSAADFAICHQETPISADNTELTVPRTLSFNAPREIATALKNAGFDACDTASNHTYDQGLKGVRQTLDVLDAAGIGHAGSSRNAEEAATPRIYDVKGVKIGHLAFSYTIDNSGGPTTSVPGDAPWLRQMLWPALGAEGVLEQARKLKERGAEFVVLSMHWGDQYVTQPNAQQRQLARQLLESPDVDLILGDHVHVVQPCEQINGEYVVYGMGNFLSNQSPTQDTSLKADNEDGTINTFTVTETGPGVFRTAFEYTPTRVNLPANRHVVPATPDRFKASYDRTVSKMNLLNRATPGACEARPSF